MWAQTNWARDQGAAVHLDGARLREAQPFYARPHAQIADLFDTAYVSFYKGLGCIGGCALAGPEDDIEQTRLWRTRHGGLAFSMWPHATDALYGLTVELPAMGELETARAQIAEQDRVWMFDRIWPTAAPEQTRIEFAVGRQVAASPPAKS